jgi:NADH-quinone oxidoreductase subunit J
MTMQQILFIVFGAIALVAALGVVVVRKLFHAALWLLLAFFGVAALYVILEAPFFAAVQLFVYMGAIGILIIFAIMLTRGMMAEKLPRANQQWWMAGLLAAALLAVLIWLILQGPWGEPSSAAVPENSMELLGRAFVDPQGFVLPFEVASVLLVMALIGALTIVRER